MVSFAIKAIEAICENAKCQKPMFLYRRSDQRLCDDCIIGNPSMIRRPKKQVKRERTDRDEEMD